MPNLFMGDEYFQKLISGVLERYAAGFLIYDQKKEWVYLLNDLIRYFRSYSAWQQFNLSHDSVDSWYMRNTKLRNSSYSYVCRPGLLVGRMQQGEER